MSSAVRMEGFDELWARLDKAARALEDRATLGKVLLDATPPLVASLKAKAGTGSDWRESKRLRDDIHASILDRELGSGTVVVGVGAGFSNAFKLRMLEFGTSRMQAYPLLRPAYDETIGQVRRLVVAGLRALLKDLR